MGVSFVEQEGGIGWMKDERKDAGIKKEVEKRQDRNKAGTLTYLLHGSDSFLRS
jgi:hypothetical protein